MTDSSSAADCTRSSHVVVLRRVGVLGIGRISRWPTATTTSISNCIFFVLIIVLLLVLVLIVGPVAHWHGAGLWTAVLVSAHA
jgi:hypothetical protein